MSSHGNITKGFVGNVLQRYTACMCQHWDSNIKDGSITRRNFVTGKVRRTDSTLATILTGHEFCRYHGYCPLIEQSASHIQYSVHMTVYRPHLSVCLSAQLSHRSEAGHTTPKTSRHKMSVLLLGENLQQPNGRFKAVNNYTYKLL